MKRTTTALLMALMSLGAAQALSGCAGTPGKNDRDTDRQLSQAQELAAEERGRRRAEEEARRREELRCAQDPLCTGLPRIGSVALPPLPDLSLPR
ncbi:hypothetical protein [Sinimarinibacterium thermocellulolyticum]|uniref:Uncharacterized protein n=1 Tax=Sinimarinibacterium thermocellulolyticum TaxID=3170016 RepID=A0ABV2A747_9GAMM